MKLIKFPPQIQIDLYAFKFNICMGRETIFCLQISLHVRYINEYTDHVHVVILQRAPNVLGRAEFYSERY